MLEYLEKRPTDVELVEMAVRHLDQGISVVNESHVDSVDLSRPMVLAEISPGQYNLIDGHHRVETARRHGLITLHAYRLTARQHIGFLTSKEAYLAFLEYWNGKVKRAIQVEQSTRQPTIRCGPRHRREAGTLGSGLVIQFSWLMRRLLRGPGVAWLAASQARPLAQWRRVTI